MPSFGNVFNVVYGVTKLCIGYVLFLAHLSRRPA